MTLKKTIVSAIFLLFIILTAIYGRKILNATMTKMKGKETVASVTKKYGTKAYDRLKPVLLEEGFDKVPSKIMFIALKEERVLEVWGKENTEWKKIKQYPFTAFSGKLGPKLKEGDRQIPEGIYQIEFLNPNSSYHLSLKVDYPNAFDRSKAAQEQRTGLGGDIFIHGKAVTIGCIPIGDRAVEEVFLLASHALDEGIKIIISPIDFRTRDEMPNIPNIHWEKELYEKIKKELYLYIS